MLRNLGNSRKFQEILGNFRKFQDILGNFRKFQDNLGNVRTSQDILGILTCLIFGNEILVVGQSAPHATCPTAGYATESQASIPSCISVKLRTCYISSKIMQIDRAPCVSWYEDEQELTVQLTNSKFQKLLVQSQITVTDIMK